VCVRGACVCDTVCACVGELTARKKSIEVSRGLFDCLIVVCLLVLSVHPKTIVCERGPG
jgi:hypothetical protein